MPLEYTSTLAGRTLQRPGPAHFLKTGGREVEEPEPRPPTAAEV